MSALQNHKKVEKNGCVLFERFVSCCKTDTKIKCCARVGGDESCDWFKYCSLYIEDNKLGLSLLNKFTHYGSKNIYWLLQ